MENLKKYIELMKNYAIRFMEWSKTNWKEGTAGKLKAMAAWLLILLPLGYFFGGSDSKQSEIIFSNGDQSSQSTTAYTCEYWHNDLYSMVNKHVYIEGINDPELRNQFIKSTIKNFQSDGRPEMRRVLEAELSIFLNRSEKEDNGVNNYIREELMGGGFLRRCAPYDLGQ